MEKMVIDFGTSKSADMLSHTKDKNLGTLGELNVRGCREEQKRGICSDRRITGYVRTVGIETAQISTRAQAPPRPPENRQRLPRSPSPEPQDPREPRRIRPPPYPHPRTSARKHAWNT